MSRSLRTVLFYALAYAMLLPPCLFLLALALAVNIGAIPFAFLLACWRDLRMAGDSLTRSADRIVAELHKGPSAPKPS